MVAWQKYCPKGRNLICINLCSPPWERANVTYLPAVVGILWGHQGCPLMLAGWKVNWEESQNNLDEIKSMLLGQHSSIPVSMGFSFISILIKGIYGNKATDILRIGHLVYLFNENLCLVNGTWSAFCGVLLLSHPIPFLRGPTTYLSSILLNYHIYFVNHPNHQLL